ncbi:hypothetical protein glysoja_042611, partial [Glycine soja]
RGGGHGFPSNQSKVSTFSERVTPYSSSGSRTSTSVLSDTEEEEVQPSSNFVGTCPYMCPGEPLSLWFRRVSTPVLKSKEMCFARRILRGRPKKTIREVIKKDLEINGLDRSMVLDRTLWRKLIHVANPT